MDRVVYELYASGGRIRNGTTAVSVMQATYFWIELYTCAGGYDFDQLPLFSGHVTDLVKPKLSLTLYSWSFRTAGGSYFERNNVLQLS